MKKTILPILLATAWISVSEFVRNEFLVKSQWLKHYENLNMTFPAEPVNGAVWGIWSLLFALFIFIIAKKFSTVEAIALAWLAGFLMMWVVIGNLNVLPYGILPLAVPLSILECAVAVLIVNYFHSKK